jgi:hypothetical protein
MNSENNLYFLSLSKAPDLKDKKERIIYRSFEILPGLLSLGTILLAILCSKFWPIFFAIFVVIFDIFWLIRILYLSLHQLSSFFKMRKNLKTNWLEKLKEKEGWENIYHLVVLPFFKEEKEIIEASIKAIEGCVYPKEKIILVLGVEERAKEKGLKIAQELKSKYEKEFFKFLISLHPKDLPGEIAGKGSNVAFAIKLAEREIIEPLKIPKENVLVSNFDIDTRPYPDYFSCLTFYFLSQKEREKTAFQPIPLYNNNIWLAPMFSRIVASSATFWQMMQQERPEMATTFSSHAICLKTLSEVEYPKNVVSDDSRIFWKAFLFYKGNFKIVPIFYPVSMDAVLAKGFLKTVINQYKQQRRWAWGCSDIPFLLFGFLKVKEIPFFTKLKKAFFAIEGFWSWATCALLLAILGWLPLIFGGQTFNATIFAYNLPRITQLLMTFAMVGLLIGGAISFTILPPKPKSVSSLKYFIFVFQWIFLPLTLIIFGSFPALDAQIHLMVGKYMGFWPTEKIVLKEKNE